MTSTEIRNTFLDFFLSKDHQIVQSAPIVIKNDPTLMFTNAGMNQFKDFFTGNQHPPYPRVANTQKCLRVSGKHNDLEEVGVDTYHHTMFEMLGNWSFGDPARPAGGYFKKEAIAWSWELLTDKFKIQKDRIYVTIFQGSEEENIPRDIEAIEEWKKWIEADRILEFGKKDNFWEMGDTGPCGPCTEIHVDTRSEEDRNKIDGKSLINADDPQVIEIWNNVFIQYNRLKSGTLEQLPANHVDTGMGFERLARVLQGKKSNYDTDVFTGTIKKIEELTGKTYSGGDSKSDIAFRVLSDHIRAIAFTIADGQLPSNTGAGYVIRRILRRAVRYYYSHLGCYQPLLFKLVSVIGEQFKDIFPELKKQEEFLTKLIKREEELFLQTLEYGLRRFNTYTDVQFNNAVIINPEEDTMTHINIKEDYRKERAKKIVSGDFAFQLYDTFGFPIDLTKLLAAEKGFSVDESGYENALQKQKDRSRASSVLETGDWVVLKDSDTVFVGYDSIETKSVVIKYRKVKSKGNEIYQLVLNKTPFYAESGGQVGDTGILYFEENNQSLQVIDTKKENHLIIHLLENIPADLTGNVRAEVDVLRRKNIMIHHTATHLLHAALRQVIGLHVTQKGSLVSDNYLRFDFSHFSKLSREEITGIEKIINAKIRENTRVEVKYMSKDEADAMGAMALFGEKYKDEVRVVIIDFNFSKELCGGTHVGATGELQFIRITSEGAIAAGVRRIEAVSGRSAEQLINTETLQLNQIKQLLNNPKDVLKSINSIQEENTVLKKRLQKFEQEQLRAIREKLLQRVQSVNGCNFIGEITDVNNAEALKKLALDLKPSLNNHVILLATSIEGKAHVVLLIDPVIAEKKNIDAAATVKHKIAPLIKGGGGGEKTLATAGGANSTDLQLVISTVRELLT